VSRRAWSAASCLLFVSYLLLHLPASDVFDGFARRFGFVAYDRTTWFIFALAGAGVWLWLWSAHESVGARVRTSLVAITVLAGLALSLLAVNGIEAIHLPQYALLVCTLSAGGLGLEAAWLVATALGGLDELWQWLLLRRAVPEYFDWNDVVLNGVGAAVGVLAVVRVRGLSRGADAAAHVGLVHDGVLVDCRRGEQPCRLAAVLSQYPRGTLVSPCQCVRGGSDHFGSLADRAARHPRSVNDAEVRPGAADGPRRRGPRPRVVRVVTHPWPSGHARPSS
jgi:hypothetical protein